MSVFTNVSVDELKPWLSSYSIGDLVELKGIASGISNTNYFVTTTTGKYERGVPCPHPVKRLDGLQLDELNGKPAAIVSCLNGRDITAPSVNQCKELGQVLANMHIAGSTFTLRNQDSRDLVWREATAKKVLYFLDENDREMLRETMLRQAALDTFALPQGVIHADLFRDNVLFDGEKIGGVIDFYYACRGAFLYDVAIAVNDWCVNEDGSLDSVRVKVLLRSYHEVRPFVQAEQLVWPDMLLIAALRFWLSRLKDKFYPQSGELTHAKDPQHFQKILQWGIAHQPEIVEMWI